MCITYRRCLVFVNFTLGAELHKASFFNRAPLFPSIGLAGCLQPKKDTPSPNWLGFMQNIESHQNDSVIVEKSDVYILPLMDEDPTKEATIYPTLINIDRQERSLA